MRTMAYAVLGLGLLLAGCETVSEDRLLGPGEAASLDKTPPGKKVLDEAVTSQGRFVQVEVFSGTDTEVMVFDAYQIHAERETSGKLTGSFWFDTKFTEPSGVEMRWKVKGDVVCFRTELSPTHGGRVRAGVVVRESNTPYIPVGMQMLWSGSDNTPESGNQHDPDSPDTSSAFLGTLDPRGAQLYCDYGLPYPEHPHQKGFVRLKKYKGTA